ncbi:hypothetical protein HII17_10470 [Thalassotalea sp. M1531]|uniref:Uncharacterized protein n=1 Tax=Thalassotalea algicola TaxID=2716224 RepID=A0A7Y0LCN1_9GAMM|nr:pilin [Thalassotalea algicola]NMP31991.1 hypothetical protein [Thalassotalea algicola]
MKKSAVNSALNHTLIREQHSPKHIQTPPRKKMFGGSSFYGFILGVAVTFGITVMLMSMLSKDKTAEQPTYNQLPTPVDLVTPTYRNHVVRANFANVLAMVTPVKMQIATHYQMTGEFPRGRNDVDIRMFDLNEHELITSSEITNQAAIKISLSKDFGQNKKLVLQPKASKNGAFIKWNCLTNIDKKYLNNTQMCNHHKIL